MDFPIQADHRVKIKENENRDSFLDLIREVKMLRNAKVSVIPIITGMTGTIHKTLVKELEELEIREHAEAIQAKVLLRLTRILRRVLETLGDSLLLKHQ